MPDGEFQETQPTPPVCGLNFDGEKYSFSEPKECTVSGFWKTYAQTYTARLNDKKPVVEKMAGMLKPSGDIHRPVRPNLQEIAQEELGRRLIPKEYLIEILNIESQNLPRLLEAFKKAIRSANPYQGIKEADFWNGKNGSNAKMNLVGRILLETAAILFEET